jgi:nickel transport protein
LASFDEFLRLRGAAFLAFGVPLPALAHDLWVASEANSHTLRYGHERSKHEGEPTLTYPADFVKNAQCFGRDGHEAKATLSTRFPARLSGTCAATVFSASSGYWTKTPYGTENKPKTEAGPAIESWESFETVKTLREWSPAFASPLGGELELVPEENPLTLKAGDKMTVRVFWRGKPRPGVTVAYHGSPRGVSGADGRVNIRLRDAGFQLLQASVDEAPREATKADKAVFATNLGFTLP